jgi:hypothetical protein
MTPCILTDVCRNFIGIVKSRGSVVGIATGYGLEDVEVGVRVSVVLRIFTSPRRPDWLWSRLNILFNGYRREADHSSPTNTEVKEKWIYASNPQYVFMA